MTENDTLIDGLTDESSRRSFMKKSAIASGGLAMGLSGAGTVAAQDGDNQDGNVMRGLMFGSQFHPRGQFEIVSAPIDWAPVEADEEGDDFLTDANDQLLFDDPAVFGQFNTRVINYQVGPGNWSMLFVHEAANVQQGQTYELSPAFGAFGPDDFEEFGIGDVEDNGFYGADDNEFTDEGYNELGMVTVQFSPVQGGGGGGGGGGGDGGGNGGGNQTDGNETA